MSPRHYFKVALLGTFGVVLFFALLAPSARASSIYGTSAGTVITAVSSNLLIEYQDANNNPQPTVTGDITVSDIVSAIFGLGLTSPAPVQYAMVSASATFTLTATNKSNTGTTINFVLNDYYSRPLIRYSDDLRKGTNEWEVSTLNGVTTYFVHEDAVAVVTVSVTVNAAARDGVIGYVTVNAFLDANATPNGNYTGLNGTSYGGVSRDVVVLSTIAMAPEIIIVTKNVLSVIAPTANGYPGNENDLVPGAKIIYQTVIKNIGMITANVTDLFQNIPANTAYLQSSLTAIGNGLSYYLPTQFGTAPEYSYSTGVFAPQDFSNPEVGTYDFDTQTGIDPIITKIRCYVRNIPAGETVTLNYAVVVN